MCANKNVCLGKLCALMNHIREIPEESVCANQNVYLGKLCALMNHILSKMCANVLQPGKPVTAFLLIVGTEATSVAGRHGSTCEPTCKKIGLDNADDESFKFTPKYLSSNLAYDRPISLQLLCYASFCRVIKCQFVFFFFCVFCLFFFSE